MSDTPPEDTSPAARRMDQVVAITRVEAKLDVFIAGQTAHHEETNRRLAEHDRLIGAITDSLGRIQQKQAAADAVSEAEDQDKPRRVDVPTWITLAITILIGLYLIIDHSGIGNGP